MVAPLWPRGRLGDYIERGGLGAAVRGFAQLLGSGGWRRGPDLPMRGSAQRPRPAQLTQGVGQTNPRVPTGPTAPPFLILDERFFPRRRKRKRRVATRDEEERILREILARQRGGLETCSTDEECERVWRGLDPSPENADYNSEEVSRRILEAGVVPYNPADDPLAYTEQAIPTRSLWAWLLALPKRIPRPFRRRPRRAPSPRPNPAVPGPSRRGRPFRPRRRRRPGQPVLPVPGPMFPGLPGNPPVPAGPAPSPRSPTVTPRPASPGPTPSSPSDPPPGGSPNVPMPVPTPQPAPAPGRSSPVPVPRRDPGTAPGTSPVGRPGPRPRPSPVPVTPPVPGPSWWPLPFAPPRLNPDKLSWAPPGTGLTPNNPPGVGYAEVPQPQPEPCRETARQRKRKRKRKLRTECYRGTYTETATGLLKRKKEKIPCRRSRKKPALRLVR